MKAKTALRLYSFLLAVIMLLPVALGSCATGKTDSAADTTDVQTTAQTESVSTEGPIMLSDLLMYKIAKCFFVTCPSTEFDEGEEVPFKDVFNYFRFAALYTFDETAVEPSMAQYYDKENKTYSVPHQIADDYLSGIFNTKPDPESIDCYDKKTGCYVFEELLTEFYYTPKTVSSKWSTSNADVHEFTVAYIHDMGNVLMYTVKYTVEMTETGYKILSVKWVYKNNSEPDVNYDSGVYGNKDWDSKEFPVEVNCVPDAETAIAVAGSVLLRMQKEGKYENYAPISVFYDTKDKIWVVSFGLTDGSLGADLSFAVREADAGIEKIWAGE